MWTIEKIEKLKEMFPNNYNRDISKELNETLYSINVKKNQLGLVKSGFFKNKISNIGNLARIANGGRNLTYDKLKEIASNYKTRIDFITGDGPAYNASLHKGILDNICSHMSVMKFSIPQLILREITEQILSAKCSYNNRKILKPYEIDVYFDEFKLGFEFQGIAWHRNNKNDVIKSKLAVANDVKIIYIHEYNGSRNYEKDIKNQLIDNLDIINKLTNKYISTENILNCKIKNIYLELYNKDELISIAKKYNSFSDFKIKERSVYRKLCKMKLIDVATSHMGDKSISKHNYSEKYILETINKYSNLTDFRFNEIQLYKHIKRLRLNDYLVLKPKEPFTIEEITNKIKEYVYKCDFGNENNSMYRFIRRNNLTYLLTDLKRCGKSVNK